MQKIIIIDTTTITEESMKQELAMAAKQQERDQQQRSWISQEFLKEPQKRNDFIKIVNTLEFLDQNLKHIQKDDALDEKMVALCQIKGRSNEDYIAARKIDTDLSALSDDQIGQGIFDAIIQLSQLIDKDAKIKDGSAGATLTACFVVCDASGKKVFTAQLGDSFPLHISAEVTRLACRHYLEDEKERLEREDAHTVWQKNKGYIVSSDNRCIAIPRGLGYKNPKIKGIISTPTISQYNVKTDQQQNLLVLTSDGPFDINDENTVSEAIKTKIFDDAKESQLFYQAAKICAISYRSIKTEENKKRIDDASAIVVDLSQMPHGNYLFVVSDGNSYYKLDKENLVAKKACKNLPVLLKTELEKHQYNSNNNRPSGQQSSFHDIENLSQEFSMLSQKDISNKKHQSDNRLQLYYSSSDTENSQNDSTLSLETDQENSPTSPEHKKIKHLESFSPKIPTSDSSKSRLFQPKSLFADEPSTDSYSEQYAQKSEPNEFDCNAYQIINQKLEEKAAILSKKTKKAPRLKRTERSDHIPDALPKTIISNSEEKTPLNTSGEAQYDEYRAYMDSLFKPKNQNKKNNKGEENHEKENFTDGINDSEKPSDETDSFEI